MRCRRPTSCIGCFGARTCVLVAAAATSNLSVTSHAKQYLQLLFKNYSWRLLFAAVIGSLAPYLGSRVDSLSGMLGGAAIGAVGALAGIFRYGACSQRDDV